MTSSLLTSSQTRQRGGTMEAAPLRLGTGMATSVFSPSVYIRDTLLKKKETHPILKYIQQLKEPTDTLFILKVSLKR